MDAPVLIVSQLLKLIKGPVSKKAIEEKLLKHPYYPSLLSITDILMDFDVFCKSYHYDDLTEATTPCIAHLNSDEFILIKSHTHEFFTYFGKDKKRRKISKNELRKIASGTVLIPDSVIYNKNHRSLKVAAFDFLDSYLPSLAFFLSVTLLMYLLLSNPVFLNKINLLAVLLICLKVLGVTISIPLLLQNINANNSFVRKVCSTTKSNCNAVLTSKASKILFGYLSLSEIGFFYFSGSLLLLTLDGNSTEATRLLYLLNVISLPFTLFSFYYQGFIIKQWCIFCCIIQGLLWMEFFIYFHIATWTLISHSKINAHEIITDLSYLLLPALLWLSVRPLVLKLSKFDYNNLQLDRIIKDEHLFFSTLNSSSRYKILSPQESFIIGKSDATNIITIVVNLTCSACGESYEVLSDWIIKGSLNFKLQTVFLLTEEQGEKACRHIYSLASRDPDKAYEALKDWFRIGRRNFDKWKCFYPIEEPEGLDQIISKQNFWISTLDLQHTPTVYLNGNKISEIYNMDSIKYYIGSI